MTTPDPSTPAPSTPEGTPPEPLAAPAVDADATIAEIAALAADLGIEPGQLKARLEASRKWEHRAKKADEDAAAAAEAARLAALGEQERAVEEARAAGRAESQLELTKLKIAMTHGIPDLADRLVGSNEAELAEDAARLKSMLTPSSPPSAVPPSSADAGPQGTPPAAPSIDEQIAAAEGAGDWKTAMALKGQKLAAVGDIAST